MKKENIKGHIGFENVPVDYVGTCALGGDLVPAPKKDPLYETIFAVDSTGHPRSDAMVYLDRSTSPEVRDYIARNMLTKINTSPGYKDGDAVLDMMQQMGEDNLSYGKRLAEYAQKQIDASQKSDKKGD